MSGGRRKSRKPQKWEDYVADEEQLANIEEELEKEEKARMLNVEEERPKLEKEEEEGGPDHAGKEDEEEWSDGSEEEAQLEIVLTKEEVLEEDEELEEKGQPHSEEMNKVYLKQEQNVDLCGDQEPLEDPLDVLDAGSKKGLDARVTSNNSSNMIGDCGACGIQLRDWSSAHSHLRFHRLSHVPDCVSLPDKQEFFRVICKVCQRTCQTREVLAYHAYTEHFSNLPVPSEVRKTSCPFCTATFNSTISFHRHLDFTIITFKCQMCGELVDQENKFYLHLVQCTRRSQPGLTNVPCCVCGMVVKLEKLYAHLLHHSTLLNLTRHLASPTKRKRSRGHREEGVANGAGRKKQQQQLQRLTSFRPFLCELCDRKFVVYTEFKRHLYSHSKSRAYVCTHCGRGYCQKNTLIVHLYTYHNAYPTSEEITPQEDTTQRWCEACGRVGFTNYDLLVRHHVLRCSQRTGLQTCFATIVNNIAKEDTLGFLEVMYSRALRSYLPLAAKAWPSPPCVRDLLERLQEDPPPKLPPPPGRREAAEFTDIQLLEYLEKFEEKHRKRDKELEFLLKLQAKDSSNQPSQETHSPRDSPRLTPEVPNYPAALPGSPGVPFPGAARDEAAVSGEKAAELGKDQWYGNLNSLVQHLRSGGEKRRGGDGEDGPLDICLVTSSTNTQVTITPATHTSPTLRPPKVARTPNHKPSVSEIRSLYPGVAVLGDVDFSRLPSLLLQMASMMDHRFGQALEDVNPKDLQRLEFEAQLLREAEPFYLSDSLPSYLSDGPTSVAGHVENPPSRASSDPHSAHTLKDSISTPQKNGLNAPNPSALARIVDELSEWKIEVETSSPQARTTRVECVPSEAEVARLLKEARELVV